MCTALYTATCASGGYYPVPDDQRIQWRHGLPARLAELVVVPVRFDVLQEYEIAADRTRGYDDSHAQCFCAYRYALTQLRSDDDEVFYEAPIYTETVTAWRLMDARWLICRTTSGNLDRGEFQSRLYISDAMPR